MLNKIFSGKNLFRSNFILNFLKKAKMSEDQSRVDYVKAQKEKYAAMSLEEKRKLYKNKYVTLDDVEKWSDYAKRKDLTFDQPKFPQNETFNEKLSLWFGDITQLEIDAVVNAAKKSLMGGGGVDGAIHAAAGPDLVAECSLLNGCETGDAKLTLGYNLPAKYVVHTVGPIGEKPRDLNNCYLRSLNLCRENSIRTVAFPCVSTGIYGYPNDAAVDVVLGTVREWMENNADSVDRIIFCLFMDIDKKLYKENMPKFFPVL